MGSIKESLKSIVHRGPKKWNKDPSVVASTPLLRAPSIGGTESSQSNLFEQNVPILPASATQRASPSDGSPDRASSSTAQAIVHAASEIPAKTNPGGKQRQSVAETLDQRDKKLSTSQRLWNAAFDSLRDDEATKKLVQSYVDILAKALGPGEVADTSPSDNNAQGELDDPIKRQEYMRKLVEEGLEKFATTSKITERLGNVVEYMAGVKGLISAAIANIPQAALPWAGVCIGLQILSNPGRATKSNLRGIVHVISRMDWYCALTEHLLNKNQLVVSLDAVLGELEKTIIQLYKSLLFYQIKSVRYYQNRGVAVLRGLANLDNWDDDLQGVKDAEAAVESLSTKYYREYNKSFLYQLLSDGRGREEKLGNIHQDLQDLIHQQQNIWADTKNKECLKDLFVIDPRDNMRTIKENKEELFGDAYRWIFSTQEYATFTDWSSGASACRLLWITGSAGTGKTMLLMGIIDEIQCQLSAFTPRLSYFFYQATKVDSNNTKSMLRSLIWLVLFQQPYLIKHIQPDHEHKGRALFENEDALHALNSIFERMLGDPYLSPVYFIIDALDECDQGLPLLLRLISKSFNLSNKVKWILSSRPEVMTQTDIQEELQGLDNPYIFKAVLKLDSEKLAAPVNRYIEYRLSSLKKSKGYSEEEEKEISTQIRQRADNTFLWVALVFKEILKAERWDTIKTIENTPRGLPELYGRMMDRIERLNSQQYCKDILIAISLAFRPLSLSELAAIARLPNAVDAPTSLVQQCGSFLTITGEMVSLIHQSAKEFLDLNFSSRLQSHGVIQAHVNICERSIEAMSATLRENVYRVVDPSFCPQDATPGNPDPLNPIRYACLYWVDHLSFDPTTQTLDRVHSFLKLHFLHWLEALSLMNKSIHCGQVISKLEATLSYQSELRALVSDAKRFIARNEFVIQSAPLQIYSSAVLFSPQASRIRDLFLKNIDEIRILSGLDKDWGPVLRIVEGDFSHAKFSPDGERLISWNECLDQPLPVVNIHTGQIEHVIAGHSAPVTAVTFSHDGSKLATGSNDTTIQVWEAATGRNMNTLSGHQDAVFCLVFSPDGSRLASGSSEHSKNLRLWNVGSGETERILDGHSHKIEELSYSPTGGVIVSGSTDKCHKVWDVLGGHSNHTLELSRSITQPEFSSDGRRLLETPLGKSIQIWDAMTWRRERILQHSSLVYAAVFLPDGEQLVSGTQNQMVWVWDLATGTVKHTFEIGIPSIFFPLNIRISPDGSRLAEYDEPSEGGGGIRLWDVTTGKAQYRLENGLRTRSVAFSPNGKTLASVLEYHDGIQVWDITEDPKNYRFDGHSDKVRRLQLSPDGMKLVSDSRGLDIRIWDITTGRTEHIFDASMNAHHKAWSPDRGTLALALDSHAICIWDVSTRQVKHSLEGGRLINCMAFSPDGRQLALGALGNVQVWDVIIGRMEFSETSALIPSVTFSPDGKWLAAGGALKLWNTTTWQVEGTPKGHKLRARLITFSVTGKLALFNSSNFKVWEIATGQVTHMLISGDSPYGETIAFSPDGGKLAVGDASTIYVWDVATGRLETTLHGHASQVSPAIFQPNLKVKGPMTGIGFCPLYSLDETKWWVTRNGERFLYLPPEFRSSRPLVTFQGNIGVIGLPNGRVIIMKFSDDSLLR